MIETEIKKADQVNVPRDLIGAAEALRAQLSEWRRDFHRFPEVGWTEFRTSAKIAQELEELGYEVSLGERILNAETRMGVPPKDVLDAAYRRAVNDGAPERLLRDMEGGLTGVVGRLEGGRPGPTIGLRFDIDALDIVEAQDDAHLPVREGFASQWPGMMHACGHDGHAAMGLGLAHLIARYRHEWPGRVVLLFQPAEEGTRGGVAMAEAGVVDDCEALLCCHLGSEAPLTGQLIGGVSKFLATVKLDVTMTGLEAHAALDPECGRNALLGAATAALNLHAISRHSGGESRINVGVLNAGSGRNVTPGSAHMKLEVRGATNEVLEYLERRARAVLENAAAMYDLTVGIDVAGGTPSTGSDPELIERIRSIADSLPDIVDFRDEIVTLSSDDAAALMKRVQDQGGVATYFVLGSNLASGHHTRTFDFDERALVIGVKLFSALAWDLATQSPGRADRRLQR